MNNEKNRDLSTNGNKTNTVDSRLDLAIETTLLAMDRTQLAWVRTVMGIITAGIALDKGAEALHQARLISGIAWSKNGHFAGLLLTITGTVFMLLVTVIYCKRLKELTRMRSLKEKIPSATMLLSVFVCLVGGLAIYFLNSPW